MIKGYTRHLLLYISLFNHITKYFSGHTKRKSEFLLQAYTYTTFNYRIKQYVLTKSSTNFINRPFQTKRTL